jgi:hypothetical protein
MSEAIRVTAGVRVPVMSGRGKVTHGLRDIYVPVLNWTLIAYARCGDSLHEDWRFTDGPITCKSCLRSLARQRQAGRPKE